MGKYKKKTTSNQYFLNQLSRDIKNGDLSFKTHDDKIKLSKKLISMIGSGSEHRNKRILGLMKKALDIKPYAIDE